MRTTRIAQFLAGGALIVAVAAIGGVTATTSPNKVQGEAIPQNPVKAPAEPGLAEDANGDEVLAKAAGTVAVGGYWSKAEDLLNVNDERTSCSSSFSGGSDELGRMYHGCQSDTLHVRGRRGVHKETIRPEDTAPVGRRDVSPNAAGTIVYYSVGKRKDTDFTAAELAAGWGSIHRVKLTEKKDGTRVWKRDTAFKFGPFKLFGGAPWSTRYMTVTPDGTLYTTVNAFVFSLDNQGRVRSDENGQYNASGTRIGGPIGGYDPSGPAPGFSILEGIASNAAGTAIFVTDEGLHYIARFTRNAAGAWVADAIAGTPGQPTTDCVGPGFAAPYDIAVGMNNNVFVADTTCGRIRRFNSTLTSEGENMLKISGCGLCFKPHGITVSHTTGVVLLPYRQELYPRK